MQRRRVSGVYQLHSPYSYSGPLYDHYSVRWHGDIYIAAARTRAHRQRDEDTVKTAKAGNRAAAAVNVAYTIIV